jgi:H+/Cl- antiporter ClcA
MVVAALAAAPRGLFTPALAVGGLLGVASAQTWRMLWPDGPPEAGACALIGTGALLAASTQGPWPCMAATSTTALAVPSPPTRPGRSRCNPGGHD